MAATYNIEIGIFWKARLLLTSNERTTTWSLQKKGLITLCTPL